MFVSGVVVPPNTAEMTIRPSIHDNPNLLQGLEAKGIHFLNLCCEAVIASLVVGVYEVIRRIFCKEIQHRRLSAAWVGITKMGITMSCFGYLRDAEDATSGLLAG